MRAVTYQGPESVAVEDVEPPSITEPTDAIVATEVAGLCGSDLHIYRGEQGGLREGMVIGHELVGHVQAVGSEVTGIQEGDRVVASFMIPCGDCRACRSGAYNGCPELAVFGHGEALGGVPGTQAEQVRVPNADLLLGEVPEGLASEEALFAGDLLAAAYTGVREHLEPGDTVATVGAGPVGLLALEVARTLGAAETYAVDLDPTRAQVARERGHGAPDPDEGDPLAHVADELDPGADLVVEAVGGDGQALADAFELAGPAAHVSALGVPTAGTFAFPWVKSFLSAVSFSPQMANVPRWMDEILDLQAAGRLEASWLTSHRMDLEAAPKAYRKLADREAIKVLFDV